MSYVGGEALLDDRQLAELDAHLQTKVYLSAKAVAAWVKERWGVIYTESGMAALLRRLGYRYKKPKLIPGKADPEAQRAFLATDYRMSRTTEGNVGYCTLPTACTRNTIRSRDTVGSSVGKTSRCRATPDGGA
jgi:hypothetical protein